MDRRDFIKLSGMASLPLMAPRLVFGTRREKGASGNVLVCVFQRGGADGLNLVVPYAESAYYAARPAIAVPPPGSNGGAIDLDGFIGLHPRLAALEPLYRDGELAFVHAAGSPDDSRSHFDAQDFMEKGFLGKGQVFDGWLNRQLQASGPGGGSPFRAVGFGQSLQLSLQGSVPAVGLAQLDDFDLAAPVESRAAIEAAVLELFDGTGTIDTVAAGVISSVNLLKEAEVDAIPVENGAVYPQTTFGARLSQLAQLIKADVGLEIAAVDIGGWDHHDQENNVLGDLSADFADSLAAFHTDLGARMDSVTLVAMTEFGRRLEENASAGTDHGHGSVMTALGGGVNGGQVYGDWPGLSQADLNRGDLEVSTDFRTVLTEVLDKRLGNSMAEEIFPEFTGPTGIGLFNP